uniref:Pol protein n=1 Tax=Tetraselmis sp. GSL018 TaxID=582737 RepID=A0A061SB24_9CHLO|mmetsp:Transcript_3787/g.9031  ORF Transcript_3787/g.9031 Transcript_3787/m.9031 type:complete len:122 (-) Transcript_3787:88-453(-)
MSGEKFYQREADATMSPLSPHVNKEVHGSASLAVIQDKTDWMFDPCLFREFDQRFGPHTLDAAAASDGSNAQLSRFCHESDSFLRKELAEGERVWMNPPYNSIHLFLLHYLEEKDRKTSIT